MNSGQVYWDALAPEYDALYSSDWSGLEDEWVSAKLFDLWPQGHLPVHVDLGAGTGLGSRLAPPGQYVAIDVSKEMLLSNPDSVVAIQADLEGGIPLASSTVDVVTALFAAVSYVHRTEQLFCEIERVLAPGGRAYLSLLSRYSLRRLVRRQRGAYEAFETRNSPQTGSPPLVRTFRRSEVRSIADSAGLVCSSVSGLGVLSGVAEYRAVFRASQLVARCVPDASHLFEVALIKPGLDLSPYEGGN